MTKIVITEKEKEEASKLELRSEQLREILGQMPRWIVRFGTIVIFGIVLIFFIGSAILKYPDIIKAPVQLTTQTPPAEITANISGRIRKFLVADKELVNKNQVLVVLESSAEFNDVLALKEFMNQMGDIDSTQAMHLPENLVLGNLQAPYSVLQKRLSDYRDFKNLDYYSRKIKSVTYELKKYSLYLARLEEQEKVQRKDLALGDKSYKRDSLLYVQGVISSSQFEKSEEQKLAKLYSWRSTQTQLASAQIEVSDLQQEILELELKFKENSSDHQQLVREAIEMLKGGLAQWDNDYVIRSPFDGQVSLTRIWSENQYIEKGNIVLTVLPREQGGIVGKVLVPAKGAGKIREGFKVVIQFDNYPYLEFGTISGKVTSISLVPTDELYSVEIKPDSSKLITNYGIELTFQQNMPGIAEIITDKKSLLIRILEPFRSALLRQRVLNN